ncbi:hypothetical protein COV18_04260 [Candidatus Woesearchaeota archaeon CG10_big_fil_rev_8_21_14_0_10_37_12]|nr:MAG: hypothetical protein COV18_04260 [Candidatus Woesearchaeota archaeon CG10_big_fil_rev_8_21_14_0_10_37_12]
MNQLLHKKSNMRFDDLLKKLEKYLQDPLMRNLQSASQIIKKIENLKENIDITDAFVNKARQLYEAYEVFLESLGYESVLCKKSFCSFCSLKRTYVQAKIEAKKTRMSKSSKVLFIGCGAFPESLFGYFDQSGCSAVGLDNHPLAVAFARKLIHEKNLSNKIKIQYGQGDSIYFKEFTHIIVAALAQPKEKILKHIRKNVNKNTVIIMRVGANSSGVVYRSFDSQLVKGFKVVDILKPLKNSTFLSIILSS